MILQVPNIFDKWTRIAVSSSNGRISFYLNCKLSKSKVTWVSPSNLSVSPTDTLHIASGGRAYPQEQFIVRCFVLLSI